jgi:hypothetical protein
LKIAKQMSGSKDMQNSPALQINGERRLHFRYSGIHRLGLPGLPVKLKNHPYENN